MPRRAFTTSRWRPACATYRPGPAHSPGRVGDLAAVARHATDLGLGSLYGVALDLAIAALSTHSLRVVLTQDLFAAGEDAGPVSQELNWRSTATRDARRIAPGTNVGAHVMGQLRT